MKPLFGLLLVCFIAAGCSSLRVDSDTEKRAEHHMALADSLEQALALDQATLEYQIVAELYPSSSAYPAAVRKTALLYMNPDNPVHNDSLALHWVSTYLALPAREPDRENARTESYLLERIAALQRDLIRRTRIADSLYAVVWKQEGLLSSQTQQLQALQNELKQVRQELDRLKQVDVNINRSRRK